MSYKKEEMQENVMKKYSKHNYDSDNAYGTFWHLFTYIHTKIMGEKQLQNVSTVKQIELSSTVDSWSPTQGLEIISMSYRKAILDTLGLPWFFGLESSKENCSSKFGRWK